MSPQNNLLCIYYATFHFYTKTAYDEFISLTSWNIFIISHYILGACISHNFLVLYILPFCCRNLWTPHMIHVAFGLIIINN